jgi:hypothetical protein
MNNPLSFDANAFISSLQGLQTFDPISTGWNDENAHSAYFIAGNSEYRVDQPQVTAGTLTLTTQIRSEYNTLFDHMIAALPTDMPSDQRQTITNTINSWRSALDAQSELPSLLLSTQVTHIIDNNQDDHCALQTTVVWLADLNIFLPINYATAYTWGIDVYAVISSGDVSSALTYQTIMSLSAEHLALGIAMDPEGMLSSILTTVAFDIYLDAMHAIDKASDDGGKLYFPAVVAQCFVRLLSAVSSPAVTSTRSVPLPRASSFSQMWKANYASSNVLDNTDYPWYSNEIDVQNNYYYTLNLPELGWLPFGTGLLLSFKLAVGNRTNGYASIIMVVSNNGTLLGCAGSMQLGNDDTIVPIPTLWRTDQTSNNQLIDQFTGVIVITPYSTNAAELYLPYQLNSTMIQAVSVFDRLDYPCPTIARSALPRVKLLSTQEYDYGSRPKIAITPSGYALELHTNGNDGIFRDVLQCTNIVSEKSRNGYYQDGEDPTATVLSDGQTIIEVHGAYNGNKTYYNIMTLEGTTLTNVSDKGNDYDKGENPCIASSCVNGVDRIFEVHRDASATSTDLYYNTATWDGSSQKLTWDKNGSNRQYASGQYPAIAFATDQTTLIEAHANKPINTLFDGGEVIDSVIWACAGTTTASSVSFSASINMMSGTTPTIAVRTGDTVVIFAELDNHLVYSIGKLQDTYISWTICGQRFAQGQRPGLGRLSNNTLVLVYENTAVTPSGQMYGAVLDLDIPTGFNVA